MICPNCNNEINDNTTFCTKCGFNINNVNVPQEPVIKQPRKKTPLLIVIFLIGIALLTVLGYFGYKALNKKPNNENTNIIENKNDEKLEKKGLNSFEKLKNDYDNGVISVNDYFTQLVYLEFNSSKVDAKYASDYVYYSTKDEYETPSILEEHYDDLSESIVKYYLINKTLANVYLGEEETIKQTGLTNNKYNIELLSRENEDPPAKHSLNRVYLSSKGNFLIWYTNYGQDAITSDQLEQIANGLESARVKYEQIFGIKYRYDPYIDNKIFNSDFKNAKKVLEMYNIPVDVLNTAMSVYIYDTGSEGTLASYNDEQDAAKLINRSLILDILDDDGVINYPYIVINRRGFDSSDSLTELYNHELFHHMQYLYCTRELRERCPAGTELTEGMANFASALISDVNGSDAFLNDWAGIYTENTGTRLEDITNGSSNGYGVFPYFYSYSKVVDNWVEVLMGAHKSVLPYLYIDNNTSSEDLVKTINHLAYYTLTQNYDNKSLLSHKGVNFRHLLSKDEIYEEKMPGGTIDFYELDSTSKVTVSTDDTTYVTIKLYGYKDGYYKELVSSSSRISVDTALYARYDKFYLVVTNGGLWHYANYSIVMGSTEYAKNEEFVTTFNNYNIDSTIHFKYGSIEVITHSYGTIDELHQKEYLDFDTTSMGFKLTNKIYYDFNSGYSYMTQPYGGDVWWKEKNATQMIDLGKVLDQLISMENVTKVEDNHYLIKMSQSDVQGLMDSANSGSASIITGTIDVNVYTENGYIIKLDYDFSKAISGFDLFTATIEYSNYDTAGDVEIPQTIIDNAKLQQ